MARRKPDPTDFGALRGSSVFGMRLPDLDYPLIRTYPDRIAPNFWSVRQISGVVICGLDWFTRFCETKPGDELAVVVVVNNVNEFEQGSKDMSKQVGGLGLGLAISNTIIDAHGGAIAVSNEGKDLGVVFSIRLPLTDEPRPTGALAEEG